MPDCKYIKKVYHPVDCKGEPGEIKNLPIHVAKKLEAEGYVEILTEEENKKGPENGIVES